jgi:SAM-dependent methyltransferase
LDWSRVNWNYFFLALIRRYLPKQVLFAVMKFRGDASLGEQDPEKYLSVWNDQFAKHHWGLGNKHVLEIGSGRYARSALRLVASGAYRVTLIDLYAVPPDDPMHRAMLVRDCASLGIDFDEALSRIEIMTGNIVDLPVPEGDQKVDIVVSHSVLEHLRDPVSVMKCCCEWLKPGGRTHHIVDLRDHNLKFRYPFEMLTFSDRVWRRWLDLGGGFHLNRWRADDYLWAARESGFVDVRYDVLSRDNAALKPVLNRLDRRFRSMPEEVLAILTISLFGRKPLIATD